MEAKEKNPDPSRNQRMVVQPRANQFTGWLRYFLNLLSQSIMYSEFKMKFYSKLNLHESSVKLCILSVAANIVYPYFK
jgi:hypothetical protein